ncbi:hypothetical protein SAMN05216167_14713 [Spirosoma endophyticum]|uniref:Uncharacterized protein n=1 Tax=Spirosoma endophyticum TaxID=662367 RepID=A0A1I2HU67_9BACT|nr:hypothetical protein SAMN05216167_14713 [Spirosoma endophyticum]
MNLSDIALYTVYILFLCIFFFGSQMFSVDYVRAMGRIKYASFFKILEYIFLLVTFFLISVLLKFDGLFYYIVDALVFGFCSWLFVDHRKASRDILHRQFHKSAENKVNREVRRTILMVRESTYSDN